MEFTIEELELLLESLKFTKIAFENYQYYPSYEFKQQRIKEVDKLTDRIRLVRKEKKHGISRNS